MKPFLSSLILLFFCLSLTIPVNADNRDSIPQKKEVKKQKSSRKKNEVKETAFEDENGLLRNPDGTLIVERMPQFPGGNINQWLKENVRYPEEAKKYSISGSVSVRFIVNSEGKAVQPEILKSAHYSLNEEAKRVILSMPRWTPGVQLGVKVNVPFTTMLHFRYPETFDRYK